MRALSRLLIFLLLLPLIALLVSEGVHQVRRGHLYLPFTVHWDLEGRDVTMRGRRVHQVRGRLTNYTLGPLAIERVEGPGLLWFRPALYRHRIESRRPGGFGWSNAFREDLAYERQTLPTGTHKAWPWSSVSTAFYSVRDSLASSGPGAPLLRDGDEVRFVLFARLQGDERAAGQRVWRSPVFRVRGSAPDSSSAGGR